MGIFGNKVVMCNQCCNHYCKNCYINIFEENEGIIICPYCRYITGNKMDIMLVKYNALMFRIKQNPLHRL